MLCWCNIIVCAIPVVMFGLDRDWGLLAVAVLNLNIHLWSYSRFRALTLTCGCPGAGCPVKGHPTGAEKSAINLAVLVNLVTYAFAFALMVHGIISDI